MSMDLLLKREGQGRNLWLFAKLELTPDEEAIIKKSRVRDNHIVPGNPITELAQRNTSRLVAVLSALSVWIGLFFLVRQLTDGGESVGENILAVLLILIVSAGVVVGWWLNRFLQNHYRESVSVSDLLTGRTIIGDEETLRMKEQAIREGAKQVSEHIAAWKSGGEWGGSSPERISL